MTSPSPLFLCRILVDYTPDCELDNVVVVSVQSKILLFFFILLNSEPRTKKMSILSNF